MYKVYCDEKLIYSPNVEDLYLIDPVVTLEENAAGTFTFKLTKRHPFFDLIKRRKSIIKVTYEDEIEFQGIVVESNENLSGIKEIACEGDLTYFNDSIQRPARYQGYTVINLLNAYINAHNAQVDESKQFTLGMVTVVDKNDYIYCYTNMETTMECLKRDLVDDLGGFFRVRYADGIRYLDYLADAVHTNSQAISLGVNLLDYKSNIDTAELATAIIPLGATAETSEVEGIDTRITIKSVNDGLDYVFNQDAVDNYGWIFKTVIFDDVKVPANLKRKGEETLSISQFEKVYIEATAVDLHFADNSIERFKLSDSIRVISSKHGMNRYFRLTKKTLHITSPEQDSFTLGKNEQLSLSARTSRVSEDITQAVRNITPASKILEAAKSNASALINGNGQNGYVVLHESDQGVIYEILVMDTPDIDTATRMWRWNQDGMGFRAKDEQGEWQDYKVAITMDGGIVADFITTGKIQGGDSYWNLNTGELKLAGEFFNRTVDDKQALTISEGAIGLFNTLPGRPNDLNGYIASGYDPNKEMGFLAISGARESEEANVGAIIGIYTQTEEDNWITPVISFDYNELAKGHTPFIVNTVMDATLFPNNGNGISIENGLIKSWSLFGYNGTYQGMVYKDGFAAYKDSTTAGTSGSFGAIYGIATDPTTGAITGISYNIITVTDGLITNIQDNPYYPRN